MASEYKKRGGGYNQSKEEGQDESQKHLDDWTKEDWQTKDGSGTAKKSDGSRQRYLPKEAWEKLSDKEKEKTDNKKLSQSKKGKQSVGNTGGAKEAGRKARKHNERGETDEEEDKKADKEEEQEEEQEKEEQEEEQDEEQSEEQDEEQDEEQEEEQEEDDKGDGKGKEKQKIGTKRSAKQTTGPNKKQEVKQTGK